MKLHPFKAQYPNLEIIPSPDAFLGSAKQQYPDFVLNGFYQQLDQEAFYIYGIEQNGREHYGLLAGVDTSEYDKNNIIRHEHTLAAKEQTMMQLTLQRQAMIKPVLLAYEPIENLAERIRNYARSNKPLIQVTIADNTQTHTVWTIDDTKDIHNIKQLFKDVKRVYIADGHHRCSTSSLLNSNEIQSESLDFGKIFSALFPYSELDIYDFNRVISLPATMTITRFLAAMSRVAHVKYMDDPIPPKEKNYMTLITKTEAYKISWKKKILKRFKGNALDAELINVIIMREILGIEDVRTDKSTKYIDGPSGLGAMLNKINQGENTVGFMIHPVSIKEFKKLTEKEIMLPPKSTWFEPRMRNGLIVQTLTKANA